MTTALSRSAEKTAAIAKAAAARCEPLAGDISERVSSFGRRARKMSVGMVEAGSEAASVVAERANSLSRKTAIRSASFGRAAMRRCKEEPPPPPPTPRAPDGTRRPSVPPEIGFATGSALPPPPAGLWTNQSSLGSIAGAAPSERSAEGGESARASSASRRESRQQRRRPKLDTPPMSKRQSRELLAVAERELDAAKAELERQRSTVEEIAKLMVYPTPAEPQTAAEAEVEVEVVSAEAEVEMAGVLEVTGVVKATGAAAAPFKPTSGKPIKKRGSFDSRSLDVAVQRPTVSDEEIAVAVAVVGLAAADPAVARLLKEGWAAAQQPRPLPEALIELAHVLYKQGR